MKIKFRGLILLMVLSIGIFLTACSSKKGSADGEKTLQVLTYANWNPFEYKDKGELVGFDIDIITAIAKKEGYSVKVKDSAWDAMFTSIQKKESDLGISGITINDERKQTYDFSNAYFVSRQSIVVPEDSTIKAAKDLIGKNVAVQNGSTGQSAVEAILGENSSNIKKVSNGTTYLLLDSKQADAVVGDDTSNQKYVESNPKSNLKIIQSDDFEKEPFGIIFPKDSNKVSMINDGLKKIIDDGSYAKIYKKWFGIEPDLSLLND
ncbi:MAG: basic amino acid ABC transporter substrate-binding protein [Streptococcaceae bacterium]|jgi:polar amino acid transport system substrate-binding protein|nr:basic amino acid ABC transporter substrate-binding protein [Streptococcaceae bacterium]MCH4178067.1 basic amino acid ABC transporter substrate-binding protein [Streptococcaceae bacterium]